MRWLMDVNGFAQAFFENLMDDLNTQSGSAEEIFVDRFCGYLSENGVVENVQPCLWQKSTIHAKVNAYSWDPEEYRLSLFVAELEMAHTRLTTIGSREARAGLRRAVRFYEYARDGKLEEYIDESSADASDLADLIERRASKIRRLDVYLLTNQVYKINELIEIEVNGVPETSFQVWDVERLQQLVNEMQGVETLHVDCKADLGESFEMMMVPGSAETEEFDCYVGYIPGPLLAKAYKKFGQRLIERNVRSFLQARGKVNKGIRDTLRTHPEMFVAYNNGISTTAEAVKLTPVAFGSNVYRIDSLTGWQIVNGGQTTASLYHAWEDQTDLSRVFVQAKLTVLKTQDEQSNAVLTSRISEYANTQNKIAFSDLGANQNIHVELEKHSRSVWAPDPQGRKSEKKWYYERARGQYLVDQSRQPTLSGKAKFKAQNPKEQVITKTQLAKYYMAWRQLPHLVSRGSEDNYQEFMRLMDRENPTIDQEFFKDAVACAILFTTGDQVVKKLNLPGYKANVVAYTVALLSYVLEKQGSPLKEIWNRQSVSPVLIKFMQSLAEVVWTYLTDPARVGVNTSQWCKRAECWNELRARSESVLRQLAKSAPGMAVTPRLPANSEAVATDVIKVEAKTAQVRPEKQVKRNRMTQQEKLAAVQSEMTALRLAAYLMERRVKVIDKTEKGGALWVIDSEQAKQVVSELTQKGYEFRYVPSGTILTSHRPAWYWKANS